LSERWGIREKTMKRLRRTGSSARLPGVSAAEMRVLDGRLTRRFQMPSLLLMENAGRGAAHWIQKTLGRVPRRAREAGAVIFCGSGNNGGDGFVAARHLLLREVPVHVVLAREESKISGDARMNLEIAKRLKVPIAIYAPRQREKFLERCRKAGVVVDALLGTGTSGPPRDPYGEIIGLINDAGRPVVALDIPSGLDADTGTAQGPAVKASVTVAMGLPKTGLLVRSAGRWVGRLEVVDLGIPIPFHSQGG
jgi:hydroxyethylthiazole kinase-like uncharacterized protein yjeF